jgi:hypothetical protein
MSEVKLGLPIFESKPSNDFYLWELRLLAILESKDLSTCVTPENTQRDPVTDGLGTVMVPTDEQKPKAAAIIINGLVDKPLRVVANHTK